METHEDTTKKHNDRKETYLNLTASSAGNFNSEMKMALAPSKLLWAVLKYYFLN